MPKSKSRTFLLACAVIAMATILSASASRAAETNGLDAPAAGQEPAIEAGFDAPPSTCRPWVYWWWQNANVTKESITKDLEAMASQGIGGFLLFDVTAYGQHIVPSPPRKIEFMSPQWRELVRFALEEAHRLGLTASINLSTCGGALRAPWSMEQHAVKKLIWASTEVQGPVAVQLERPECTAPYYHPVAMVAAKVGKATGKPGVGTTSPWSNVQDSPRSDSETATEVVDLTGKIDANGQLQWNAPEGRWILLRMACVVMEDRIEDVDILNVKAVENHFDRMGRVLIADAGPLVGKTLTHFYNVSWEGETPSWTPGFERDFLKFRGYDMQPYLPALAGIRVVDETTTTRFLRDYALTISDCFKENCYNRFDILCREAGLQWHSESGGPWRPALLFREADQLAFWGRNAMPQGEFWVPNYRSNAKRTAQAAHVYGKRLAAAEAFTHMTYHWSQYPASLKPAADLALCDGINQFIWHTSPASPEEFGLPGIVYFAGTHVNRNVTWFPYAAAFFDYLGRCQTLLRQGNFVADLCVYASDKNDMNWTRGTEWSKEATLQLPPGYSYDLLNAEVLVTRTNVDAEGNLVLPDGMKYRMLVVDLETNTMPVEALRKVAELVEAGATVVLGSRKPTHTPGLKDYVQATEALTKLAGELWDAEPGTVNRGKGKVITGTPLDKVLADAGILPDFEGTPDYIHRCDGEVDIYFVAGQGTVGLTFRIADKEPELWDAATGRRTRVARYGKTKDGRITIPMTLPLNGSTFVVFRKAAKGPHITAANGPARILVGNRDGNTVPIQFWKDGRYTFGNSAGKQFDVEIGGVSEAMELDQAWEVAFAPGWGAPESITFDQLVPWDTHANADIKHFSGTATYRKRIELTAEQAAGLLRLDLGNVGCIARVRLNGKDMGVVWTAPWTVDLSQAAKAGENLVEIDVANTWNNRLIGDAGLPEHQRRTRTNVVLEEGKRTRRYRCSSINSIDPLTPSGLIGPVRLQFGQEKTVAID